MYGFDIHKIMFEVTEGEQIVDRAKLVRIFESYAKRGFITAIDDFGSGFADLSWLDALRPQVLKLDMTLIRDIDVDKEKQLAVDEILRICLELNTRVLAEGLESEAELNYLAGIGIEYFQGYYFAKPKLEHLTTYEELNFHAP